LNEVILAQAGLLLPTNKTFELFRQNLGYWTTVKVNHVIDVTPASPQVFIKTAGIRYCKGLANFVKPLSTVSPDLRMNLAGEQAYVRRKMIECEISQSPAPLPRKKHRCDADNSPTTPSKRPRLHLDGTPTTAPVRHLQPLLLPNPLYTRKLARPQDNDVLNAKSFFLSSPCTDIQQEDELDQPSSLLPSSSVCKSWPVDFYAIDIANCFQEIQSPTNKKKVRAIFEQHFAVPFKSSTFYDHQDRWKQASLDTKETFLLAGRTEAGLWVHFMAVNPARDAALKAARRREARKMIQEKLSLEE
jgi:hypothetical protein